MAFIDWGRWAGLNKDKGEQMAAKTLESSQGVFNRAEGALNKAASGREYDTSAIDEADAKRKALQGLGGIAGEQKTGGNVFDAALQQGAMGNAYSQMGDYQKRLQGAQQQGRDWRARTDETARRHALAQMAQTGRNEQALSEFDRRRPSAEAERTKREAWARYDSAGDYAGYSDWIRNGRR